MRILLLFFVAVFAICAETVMATDDGVESAYQVVAGTIGEFADKFLNAVANETSSNVITSPLSAQVILAMVAYGAGGPTATQIRSALQIPSDNELGQSGYQSLIEDLNAVRGVELRLINKIYTAAQFEVKTTYKQLTATKFLSESQEVDFNNIEAAANTINSWCEVQTNNRIKDLINPDTVDPDTKLILVNAVYFKGQWAKEFDPAQTQNRPFYVDAQTIKYIPTMFMERRFRVGRIPELDARFIDIPYKRGQLSMVIILPNKVDGLKQVYENIHQSNLTDRLKQGRFRTVELFLPKFKIETKLNLRTISEKLGMTTMFHDGADFSGIADIPLKVSEAVQKAFIEVNEEGTEAAAATDFQISGRSFSLLQFFKVNRPFYYQIRYANLNMPIFTGLYLGL